MNGQDPQNPQPQSGNQPMPSSDPQPVATEMPPYVRPEQTEMPGDLDLLKKGYTP